MVKKVLIISTSLRGGSNSDILANECAKGAKEAGHDVELLSLKGKDIKYCIGCLSCQSTGMCVQKDDIADIMAKVKNAEVVHVFHLNINGIYDEGLRKILEDYSFEFYAAKLILEREYDKADFWKSFDAIKQDLIKYIYNWIDSKRQIKQCIEK